MSPSDVTNLIVVHHHILRNRKRNQLHIRFPVQDELLMIESWFRTRPNDAVLKADTVVGALEAMARQARERAESFAYGKLPND